MPNVVRAAALRGLPAIVDRLGGDGSALLARFRVPPGAPDSDGAMLPVRTFGRLLEAAAAECDCPDLGLRLAEQQDTGVLGPLSIALENSATLGDALRFASRFLFVHSQGLQVEPMPDPEGVAGTVALVLRSSEPVPPAPQLADYATGLFHRVVLLLHGGRYGLRSVHLPHPPLAPVARYADWFGSDVRFHQDPPLLRVPATLLGTAVPGGNPVLRDIALDYMATHFAQPGQPVSAQVRLLLTRSLGSAPLPITSVARLLNTHPRTLQRQLAAESTTFEAILDDVRRATAHQLITETDLPFSQVTGMIGFTEQSALSRAARRWLGRSPRALRGAGAQARG